MSRIARPSLLVLALIFSLAACSPRELPPQLAATAAAPYILTDSELRTGLYTLVPPAGWRIISGPAEDPYTFQFIAPENDALIVVSNHAQPNPPVPAAASADTLAIQPQTLDLNGTTLHIVLVAPQEALDSLLPLQNALITSIR